MSYGYYNYKRSDVKQDMLNAFRTIADAVRKGQPAGTVGQIAAEQVNKVNKGFHNEESFKFGAPGNYFNTSAPAVMVSTETLKKAGNDSTDQTSNRQSAIKSELSKRFGPTEAAKMIDPNAAVKAALSKQISDLQRQVQAL
jgi:hypothetical protein